MASNVSLRGRGGRHTCALLTGGNIHCWGSNNNGQLGSGSTSGESGTPRKVQGLTDLVQPCRLKMQKATGPFSVDLRYSKTFRDPYKGFRCVYQPPINPALRRPTSCGVDEYLVNPMHTSCQPVGIGYYSPNGRTERTPCTNKSFNADYTSSGGGSNNCSFSCKSGYRGSRCNIPTSCGVNEYLASSTDSACSPVSIGGPTPI